MTRVWTLVAAALVVAAAATPAHASTIDNGLPRSAVTALSVVPSSSGTEVVIGLDGSVDVRDFVLESPHRIVIDLEGAQLSVRPRLYDKVSRGGITNVRFSQFSANVVRVVIELDGRRKYELVDGLNDVRVVVDGPARDFAAWHTSPAVPRRESVAQAAPRVTSATFASELPHSLQLETPRKGAPALRQSQQPRITVTYQDADIRDVLAAFAAFSGRTIVVGRSVQGEITAEIRDQPWDVALQAILTSQGLAASEDQNSIITVDSYQNILAKQSSEPLVTQLVSVNYARAGSLVETMKSLLVKDCQAPAGGVASAQSCVTRGSVSADTATNTLVVTEVPSRINDLLGYVRDLDVRTPQVAIKAKIVLVDRTALEQFNIAYDFGTASSGFNAIIPRGAEGTADNNGVIRLGGNILTGIANASARIPGAPLRLAFSTTLGKFSLTSFLDAAQSINVTDVQAEPTIVTLDNRKAEILVGEETPIRVVDAAGGGEGGARASVSFKETGIILSVTPHITNNRRILMQVHAERSNIAPLAEGDLGYFFLKERADNQILVNDGETAVIGGLTRTTVTRSRSGIPILINLPFIGKLFGTSLTSERKQDLLILITPHIIDEGESVDAPAGDR